MPPRRQCIRLFRQRERFLKSTLLRADCTERTQSKRKVLIDLQDSSKFGLRVLEPAGVPETDREMVSVQNIQRILLKPSRHRFNRFRAAPDRQQVMIPIPEANVA